MKIKIDENIPIKINNIFLNHNFDSLTVYDELLKGIEDEKLLNLCSKEKRTLITLDLDFISHRYQYGIIILRLSKQNIKILEDVVTRIINFLNQRKIQKNEIWIVDEAKIRIKKL